jgi:hypothetical protein
MPNSTKHDDKPKNKFAKIVKVGRCKLGWLKSDKNPNPKSPYFNTRMEKSIKNQF